MVVSRSKGGSKLTLDFAELWDEYFGHQIGFFLFIIESAGKGIVFPSCSAGRS